MKALSLTQPWATFVAIGAKRIETRSWSTNYRGPIAIHASKSFPHACVALCGTDPFEGVLLAHRDAWSKGLPTGAIVAVAMLTDVWPTHGIWQRKSVRAIATEHEAAFGDYAPGRFAWLLSGVRTLHTPIPCKGALGLWTVPADVQARILAEAA